MYLHQLPFQLLYNPCNPFQAVLPRAKRREYKDHAEAEAAFMDCLKDYGVDLNYSWEQAAAKIQPDDRFNALLTVKEKKAAFSEYQGKLKIQERDMKRDADRRARDELRALFEANKSLTVTTKYQDVESMYMHDLRFTAVPAYDRQRIFQEFMENLVRRHQEMETEQRQVSMNRLYNYFKSRSDISSHVPWRRVQEILHDDPVFNSAGRTERLHAFEQYIREADAVEYRARQIERDGWFRAARLHRDAFRELLAGYKNDGTITPRSRWHDFVVRVKDDRRYLELLAEPSGSLPRDLFDDIVDDLYYEYRETRSRVKRIIKAGNVTILPETTVEELLATLQPMEGFQTLLPTYINQVLTEMIERVQRRARRAAEKQAALARKLEEGEISAGGSSSDSSHRKKRSASEKLERRSRKHHRHRYSDSDSSDDRRHHHRHRRQ
eukprot:TRINITY_DN7766_c0_g1_i2.p1 TRINITY_DN7766_c0_g1~~TRINITY_DN7766_c0_g1_i2.p1  ORF type:complete len:438 (-),score=78.35 TRINITY_DN7766_c0_g1_i2:14-1327(-)